MRLNLAPLASAFVWLLVLAILGCACISAGAFVLAGTGVALIVVGVALLAGAAFILRGVKNHE